MTLLVRDSFVTSRHESRSETAPNASRPAGSFKSLDKLARLIQSLESAAEREFAVYMHQRMRRNKSILNSTTTTHSST